MTERPLFLVLSCSLLAQTAAVAQVPAAAAAPVASTPRPADAAVVPAGAERAPAKFVIEAFDVAGVTALPVGEVERLVYPFAGPDRTNEDVESARKALQDAYAARGFSAVVVEVPVQSRDTFAQGIVQLAVSEVPLGLLTVSDSRYHALSVTREAIPSLVAGKPIDVRALQADVTQANRFPDRTVNPVFKPGRRPGTLDVDLAVVDHRPLHASLQLDNDNSPSTTPLRMTANVRYTNLFQTGQTFTLTYINAPQQLREVEVVAGSYSVPLLNSPWQISVSGYYSNSDVASVGGSTVLGAGYQVGVRAQYVTSSEHLQRTFSFGPDFKDFKQKLTVAGAPASNAPVRYVPVELQYAVTGASEHSNYGLTFGTTFGLRAVKGVVCTQSTGACVPGDVFQNREANSYENFVHADLSLDYSYALANDIVGAFRLSAQLADSHLITNEQYSGGGLRSVRGYYSSEAVGDDGVAASLELRSPSFAPLLGAWLTEARFYGFVDSAFLKVIQPLPDVTSQYSLIGVGGGLSVRAFRRFSGQVLGAAALHDGVKTKQGDIRVNFVVKGDF
jgi:hemolysin activation/secretion protein